MLFREALAMRRSAQPRRPVRCIRPGGDRLPALAAAVLALLLIALLAAPLAAPALAPRSWLLQDQDGRGWSLTLLEQADPAYPAGLRLRLTDRSDAQRPDHSRPLRLSDGTGGSWQLANRSQELVPAGEQVLPPGSAQFDLAALQPRPRSELPLLLQLPLDSGAVVRLIAGPAPVAALHDPEARPGPDTAAAAG